MQSLLTESQTIRHNTRWKSAFKWTNPPDRKSIWRKALLLFLCGFVLSRRRRIKLLTSASGFCLRCSQDEFVCVKYTVLCCEGNVFVKVELFECQAFFQEHYTPYRGVVPHVSSRCHSPCIPAFPFSSPTIQTCFPSREHAIHLALKATRAQQNEDIAQKRHPPLSNFPPAAGERSEEWEE